MIWIVAHTPLFSPVNELYEIILIDSKNDLYLQIQVKIKMLNWKAYLANT